MLVCVDDCILKSKDSIAIPNFIKFLESGSENFIFTDEGSLSSYLGVSMDSLPDGSGFTMSQPFLLDRISKAVGFDSATTKSARDGVPAVYPLLNTACNSPPPKANWKYRSVTYILVHMLGYLQGTSRPDISIATHQCARFCSSPNPSHERVVKRIVRYLLDSRDKRTIFALTYPKAWNAL